MRKTTLANTTSVAMQHKAPELHFAKLTNNQLHEKMLDVRDDFFNRCVQTQAYAVDILLPACAEIIQRYKMQGVAAKDRPNGKPTVEAYFRSINLNYNTVRSWLRRKRLSTEMFVPAKVACNNPDGKVPHLTQLEARLLATASAGYDLVKAIKQGGNVDEAIKDFEDHAPTPERIEEYIERPVEVATTEVEKMAVRLCQLIDRNDDKNGQKILALARELLTKIEPTAMQRVLAEEKKRPQRWEAGKPIARRVA